MQTAHIQIWASLSGCQDHLACIFEGQFAWNYHPCSFHHHHYHWYLWLCWFCKDLWLLLLQSLSKMSTPSRSWKSGRATKSPQKHYSIHPQCAAFDAATVPYAVLEAKVKDAPTPKELELLLDFVNVGDDILRLLLYRPACHDRCNGKEGMVYPPFKA